MTGKQWVILASIVLLGGAVLLFIVQGVGINKSINPEGDWVCQSGQWVKFGETNNPRPVSACN